MGLRTSTQAAAATQSSPASQTGAQGHSSKCRK